MARRSKQVAEEIAAALASGSSHPKATVSDWKKRIAEIQSRARRSTDPQQRAVLQQELTAAHDGLRAAQRAVAVKPTFLTDTNVFALKSVVLEHNGPEFSNRLPAVHAPHIKRAIAAGLVEVLENKARLTSIGREKIGDEIIKDIERESRWKPSPNPFVPAEKRAEVMAREVAEHAAKVKRLEEVLAKLSS